jgi:hypothetical protein
MTTPLSFMNMPILTYIKEISPASHPVHPWRKGPLALLQRNRLRGGGEPKELMIIRAPVHVDLYDRMDKIPFDKLTAFFQKNLAASA